MGHSLTRGWVCNLLIQVLLGLANAATLGSKSSRTRDHTLLSFETGFPLCCLLCLAGLWLKYSNPPPHGLSALTSVLS
jgi:hypothetical protein